MHSLAAARRERPAIAAMVLAAHLLVAWLWVLMAREGSHLPDPVADSEPMYIRILEKPRPEPLGTPAPVKLTLLPVTRPKVPTPEVQLFEIETLDSPSPGPDPAPSSAQLVTRPGPGNAGGKGYPASMGTQQLKLVRRVAPVYPIASIQRGEVGVVLMNAKIDERGRVTEVKLLRSSGYLRIDESVMTAVAKWRFEPLVQAGRPTGTWLPVSVVMSPYQQKYCRIRDVPANQSTEEEVHDGSEVVVPLGSDAVLRKLIEDLSSDNPDAPDPIRAMLRDWGPVLSVRHTGGEGLQGWVEREILPAYQAGRGENTVQVRSDMYLVQHLGRVALWRVETDRNGEIWCAHAGPVTR